MKLLLAHGMFKALSTYFLERPIVQQNCLNHTTPWDYQVMLSGAYFILLSFVCLVIRGVVIWCFVWTLVISILWLSLFSLHI